MKELLTNSNFLKLWASQLLSQITIQIMNFFVLTRVFSVTHSTIAVSFVWIVSSLPALLFAPLSGAIVDSFSRRKTMIVTNILQAAVIFSAIFIRRGIFLWYLIVFLYWLLDQLYLPSQQASVPNFVSKKLLPAANGLFLLTQQTSILLGFGLGGLLLSWLSSTGLIILASFCLLLAGWAVFKLPADESSKGDIEKDLVRFWEDFQAGYRYVRTHRFVLLPLGLIVLSQIFVSILSTILPAYAHNVLHLRLNYVGIALVVPGGIGAVVATYMISNFARKWRKKNIIQKGILLGGVAHLALAVLAWFPNWGYLIASLVAVSMGVAVATIIVPAQTLLQEKTPKNLLGRVYSQLSLLMTVFTCVPLVIAAGVADIIGDAAIITILGIILLSIYFLIKKKGDHVLANGFGI